MASNAGYDVVVDVDDDDGDLGHTDLADLEFHQSSPLSSQTTTRSSNRTDKLRLHPRPSKRQDTNQHIQSVAHSPPSPSPLSGLSAVVAKYRSHHPHQVVAASSPAAAAAAVPRARAPAVEMAAAAGSATCGAWTSTRSSSMLTRIPFCPDVGLRYFQGPTSSMS